MGNFKLSLKKTNHILLISKNMRKLSFISLTSWMRNWERSSKTFSIRLELRREVLLTSRGSATVRPRTLALNVLCKLSQIRWVTVSMANVIQTKTFSLQSNSDSQDLISPDIGNVH
jgi:hypothetical protein